MRGTPEWGEIAIRETLADSVYAKLRDAILRGDLPDGAELNQVEIAARLGVSRVPVREALRRLQAERLVVAKPFYRYVVLALDSKQVLDLIDARAELEVLNMTRVVADTREWSRRLREAQQILPKFKVGEPEWAQLDRAFHSALLGGDTVLAILVEDIRDWVGRYLYSAGSTAVRHKRVAREHARLLKAFAARDPVAVEAAVRDHIMGTRAHVEQYFQRANTTHVDA